MTPGDWVLRLSSRSGTYHRVDGPADVIALVKTAEDARAIAALPSLSLHAETLATLLEIQASGSVAVAAADVRVAVDNVRAALNRMWGIK